MPPTEQPAGTRYRDATMTSQPAAGPPVEPLDLQRGWPGVSVIMPVLNEREHLREAVFHVLAQDYPGPVELVLALGPSTDGTDEVADALHRQDDRIRSVPNLSGRTPDGLNAALAVSRYPVVLRVDAHGMLGPAYMRTAVRLLAETGAANVGGVMAAEGGTDFQQAVAAAMTSPLGVGAARFHTGGQAGPADTVYLGVFRREWLDRLGGYDPSFARAQDWQLNYRIRQAGGVIWFDPALRVSYRPRRTLRRLAAQYRDYGRWRRVVMRRHTGYSGLRYLAPPAALVAVTVGLAAGLAGLRVAFLLPGGYAAGVGAGSVVVGRGLSWRSRLWLPVVIATMHGAWAVGFLTSPSDLGAATAGQQPDT